MDVQFLGETRDPSIDLKIVILRACKKEKNIQHRSRSSGRPSSKGGHPEESERHRTKSRSRSHSPSSRHGSVSSVVVHPAQDRHEREDKTEVTSAPAWAKSLLEAQERSQLRLEKLEAEIRKSERKGKAKMASVSRKTIYEEQYDLNMEIYNKLELATNTEDVEERNTLPNEGIELITQGNKVSVLTNKYGWEKAMWYGTDPVANDS